MKRPAFALGILVVLGVLPALCGAHSAPAHRHWNGYTFYVTTDQYIPAPYDTHWGKFEPACATAKFSISKTHGSKIYREED